jgi:hypothetical protein
MLDLAKTRLPMFPRIRSRAAARQVFAVAYDNHINVGRPAMPAPCSISGCQAWQNGRAENSKFVSTSLIRYSSAHIRIIFGEPNEHAHPARGFRLLRPGRHIARVG